MELTKNEQEILLHRLEVPDCILEVLCEDYDDINRYNMLAEEIEFITHWVQNGKLPENPTLHQRVILAELLEGSTFCGAAKSGVVDGLLTKKELNRIRINFETLAMKINAYIGWDLERIPLD